MIYVRANNSDKGNKYFDNHKSQQGCESAERQHTHVVSVQGVCVCACVFKVWAAAWAAFKPHAGP